MKVAVTGALGFIGSHVVDTLNAAGHDVLALDNESTGRAANLNSPWEFCDVSRGELVHFLEDAGSEAIIHLAAQPAITTSWDNPIGDAWNNVIGTLNVIRSAQTLGIRQLVMASTSAVYSITENDPHNGGTSEEHPLGPTTPYGISKCAAETYTRVLFTSSVVLRFGNVYGPRQHPIGENQVIARMLNHLENGADFFIHGDGHQTRDFVHVRDVAHACVLALNGVPGIYNIATGISTSVMDIAHMVEDIYGLHGYNWQHTGINDTRRSVRLNINAARKGLSWWPKVKMMNGLRDTVQWWREKNT